MYCKMTIFGYVRKNYPEETSVQINQLMALDCDDLFIEKADLTEDKELCALLNQISDGDTIIVPSLLSFGKSVNELYEIVSKITLRHAKLIGIKEELDTESTYTFYQIYTIIHSINKEVASEKIKQALEEKKMGGQQLGRPTIDQKTVEAIKYLRQNKKLRLREIAEICDVSVGTAYKYSEESE